MQTKNTFTMPKMKLKLTPSYKLNLSNHLDETVAKTLTASPLDETTGAPSYHRLISSSKTWNPITFPWMEQLTWLRIVHSGDWCLFRHNALLVVD